MSAGEAPGKASHFPSLGGLDQITLLPSLRAASFHDELVFFFMLTSNAINKIDRSMAGALATCNDSRQAVTSPHRVVAFS